MHPKFKLKKAVQIIGTSIGLVLIGVVAVISWNTVNFVPEYPALSQVPAANIDTTHAVDRLSAAVQIPTISERDAALTDSAAFVRMHAFLEDSYPAFSNVAERILVSDLSILYRWEGSDSVLQPILLSGHLDVTRVENADRWKHDPFSGTIDSGHIWGRGAIDNKAGVVAMMEAVELLAADGYIPERTVYLSFGHDEETGGSRGAAEVTRYLSEMDQKMHVVIDEGGVIARDAMDGLDVPIALIGIAEKGSFNLELSVVDHTGHSAAPPEETSIEILSQAISAAANVRLQSRITDPVSQFLQSIGPLLPLTKRLALSNRWLFDRLVVNQLLGQRHTAAMVQTSSSTTMVSGGVVPNVLPEAATAVINFRLLPGDDTIEITRQVVDAIADPRVNVAPVGKAFTSSAISSTSNDIYGRLESIASGLSEKPIVVAPYLFVAGSDSKYYSQLSPNVYRFSGLDLTGDELKSIHGVNERVSASSLATAIQFYYQFIRSETSAQSTVRH